MMSSASDGSLNSFVILPCGNTLASPMRPLHFLICDSKYRTSHCSLSLQHCSLCAVSCTHFTTALCPLSRCLAVTRRSEGWSSVATGPGVKKVDCILQFSISSQHRAVLHSPGSQPQHCSCTPDTMLCCSDGHDSLSPPLPSCRLITSPAQPTTLQCCSQCCMHSAVQLTIFCTLQSARSGNINQ